MDSDTEVLAKAARSSLYVLATAFLGYKDVTPFTHKPIIEALESPIQRKLICVPRGSLKSSLACVAYPIWLLIRNPNLRILIDSELFTNSRNFLREIRAHLKSSAMVGTFGRFTSNTWNDTEIIINQRTHPYKEASISVGGVGTTKVGQHYDCVHPESLILTSNGFIQAQDIRPKMRVYTSSGKFESVKNVITKQTDKNLIGLRSQYQHFVNWVTEDHQILTFRNHCLQWVEAGNLTTSDFMCVPINQGKTRQLSKVNSEINRLIGISDIWRLIGYWLADGAKTPNSAHSYQIRITMGAHLTEHHEDAKHIVETYLKVPCNLSKTKSSTVMVTFSHKDFKEILAKFGTRATDKLLPAFALNEDFVHLKELIRGYWRGDGSITNHVVSFSSISHDLLSGFQLIFARFGIASGINLTAKAGLKFVANNKKLSNCKNVFTLSSSSPLLNQIIGEESFIPLKPIRSFFTDKFWLIPLRSIEIKPYQGAVIDLEVSNCHDFYMPGMIAHNCIIGDDYNSPANSKTPEMSQKVIDHYKYNLSILEPDGTYVLIGTRYSENDLLGWVLREQLAITGFPETKIYDIKG